MFDHFRRNAERILSFHTKVVQDIQKVSFSEKKLFELSEVYSSQAKVLNELAHEGFSRIK